MTRRNFVRYWLRIIDIKWGDRDREKIIVKNTQDFCTYKNDHARYQRKIKMQIEGIIVLVLIIFVAILCLCYFVLRLRPWSAIAVASLFSLVIALFCLPHGCVDGCSSACYIVVYIIIVIFFIIYLFIYILVMASEDIRCGSDYCDSCCVSNCSSMSNTVKAEMISIETDSKNISNTRM